MSTFAPEGRVVVREALPALGQMAMLLFVVGCIYCIDGFVRGLFATATGAVGWIPYAGRVLRTPIHKIEQKVTHALGRAELAIDARIGASFHKLAQIARQIPGQLLDQAKLLFGIAALLLYVPTKALVHKFIHVATAPLRSGLAGVRHAEHGLEARVKALRRTLAHAVLPRFRAIEATLDNVFTHELPALWGRARAAERSLGRLRKWVKHRRIALTTGAFIGALVWALGRLGIAWVRCSNVKKVGRALCRAPSPLIDALIAGLLAELVLADFDQLVRFAQDTQEEVTHEVARLLGLELPRGPFTIE